MYKGFHHELGTRLALNSLGELALTNKTWRTPTDMEATKYLCKSSLSTCESAQRDPGTASADVASAVDVLFASAGRQKRSYIRHFAGLVETLGDVLQHVRHMNN